MNYKIPKTTLRGLIDLLKSIKLNLENLESILTEKLDEVSYTFLSTKTVTNVTPFEEKYKFFGSKLTAIAGLKKSISLLITSIERDQYQEYIPNFDAIVAFIGTNNIYFMMIVVKVIENNARLGTPNSYNIGIEKILASCFDGFLLKEGAKDLFMTNYQKYLNNGHDYLEFLNGKRVEKAIIESQINTMSASLDNFKSMYHLYVEKQPLKKEYVSNPTPTYTKPTEVKEYFQSGSQKVCDPRILRNLLVRDGYDNAAIYSMLRQMIYRIGFATPDVVTALLTARISSLGTKYLQKWQYILAHQEEYYWLNLGGIFTYLYVVSGIDIECGSKIYQGYGYTDEDLDEFMQNEINIVYEKMYGPVLEEGQTRERKIKNEI